MRIGTNHRISPFRLLAAVSVMMLVVVSGCSSKKSNPTLPDAHPDTWIDTSSSDFHGYVALQNGVRSCAVCHGADWNGGDVGVSCFDCHGNGRDNCAACHGGLDNATGAPPLGLTGQTSDSALAVGAHTAHIEGEAYSDGIPCQACHIVPQLPWDSSHFDFALDEGIGKIDSVAELTWGDIAVADGAVWDRNTRTCGRTYCHGNFGGGHADNTPAWTVSDGVSCGSCHDIGERPASLGWKHDLHIATGNLECRDCHASVVDGNLSIIGRGLHINGIADTLTRDPAVCETCHGAGAESCVLCHGGTDNETGAPPRGLRGEIQTSALAVGAHTRHLDGGELADGFACTDCHVEPQAFGDPGHLGADSIAELTWSTLAGHQSVWERNSATCASTYCHGGFDGGNANNTPVWTGGPNQSQCGSCHDTGSDPASLGWKHQLHVVTGGLACADCHSSVVSLAGIITGRELHVNGVPDTLTRDPAVCETCHGEGTASCTLCHGGTDNQTGAPPQGLRGETATTTHAVGAHTRHLEGGALADAFSCNECHVVPAAYGDPGHLGVDSIPELSWGALAGHESVWNGGTATCASSYCHGNFAGGNSANTPVWTGGSSEASCGSCHDVGADPATLGWKHDMHVVVGGLKCADCHASVVDLQDRITSLALHVNGVADTLTRDPAVCETCHGQGTGSCTICHGGTDNNTGAPPVGIRGEVSTTETAVGAHTIHLEGGTMADAFACDECHVVPAAYTDLEHLGSDSVAELTFGALAGMQSSWDHNARTCAGIYCHGQFVGGHIGMTPIWTEPNQAACGSCHDIGDDPVALGWKHEIHVAVGGLKCADCHAGVVDLQNDIVGLDLHVNGVPDTLTRDPEVCDACHGPQTTACTLCHGGQDNLTGAPPIGLDGEIETTSLAVGAHSRHVEGGQIADAFACTECHIVPIRFSDPGHFGDDDTAELTWGTLAGHESVWNRTTATCASTYCHGNFGGGEAGNVPVWTGAGQATCGSCHDTGSDPASLGWKHEMHITTGGLDCADCHAATVDQQLTITGLNLHVNGVVDTLTRDHAVCETCHGPGTGSCTLCHGGLDNQSGAPPVGIRGETAISSLAVGAHTTHLSDGLLSDAFACTECHAVPAAYTDPGHLGADSIAELTWGTLAGHESAWSRSEATCASTYCHGNFTGGESGNLPIWTDENPAVCGSCHDIGTAPANLAWKHEVHMTLGGLACADCHAAVVDLQNDIIAIDLHVNGVADTLTRDPALCLDCHGEGQGCTLCHGGTTDQTGAPPVGLHGETATDELAVGAHAKHLDGGVIADAFECTECHILPLTFADPGHFGADSIAEMTWGTLAGHASTWNRDNATCASTYCHGNFAGGLTGNTPTWTGTNQAGCGSCHDAGNVPASLGWHHEVHVTTGGLACADCHAATVNLQLGIIGLDLHVNGVIDTLTRDPAVCQTCHGAGGGSCVLCHGGTDNTSGAPPRGLHGEASTSTLAVGAHTIHLEGGTQADAFTCDECHVKPNSLESPGHLGADSIAEMTWGTLAGGASSWNRSSATCGSTYCHGNFGGGEGTNAPVWTGSNQAACGSCHDIGSSPASLGWKHDVHISTGGLDCADCHFSVVDQSLNITGLALHVNGVADTLTRDEAVCNTCHGPGTQSCNLCHGGVDNQTGAPPAGLHGETATSALAVGAHTTHLEGGAQADAFACNECHAVPVSFTDPGHLGADSIAEMTWGTLAGGASNWNRSSATCGSTYCHGNFGGGEGANVPVWTGSNQAACGSCHDIGSSPASLGWKHDVHISTGGLDCADCHFSVVDQSLNITGLALHVNGVADTLTRDEAVCNTCHGPGTQSCNLCHGGVDNQTGAPPAGLHGETATSALAVGAHTTHLEGGVQADAFACSECHVVPVTFSDPGHLGADSIAEMTWGTLAGGASNWNRSSATCGSTYCHGNFGGGEGANVPVWTGSNQATCGSCHDIGSSPASLGWKHDVHISVGGLDCADCHFSVVDQSLNITGLALHVNGVADTLTRDEAVCNTCHGPGTQSCSICHGGVDNQTGAPPQGLRDETATSTLAVGAHTTHLEGGVQADAFACSECHVVPVTFSDPGHLGADSIAEMTWGTLAGGASNWNRSSATCGSTYCHGNFGGGEGTNAPVWTGSNQAACGSCHDIGTTPSKLGWKHDLHVRQGGLDCVECHSSVVDALNNVTDLTLHVNGVADTLTRDVAICNTCHGPGTGSCNLCHGGVDNTTGAPPVGLHGETATSALAVGAHTTHLEGGIQADAFACTECHVVPASFSDPGHFGADSIAEMTWGALAGGASSWNRSGATCASTYCHGNFAGGDGANTPVWTGSNQANCGSCHDMGTSPATLGWKHEVHMIVGNLQCADCHFNVVNLSEQVTNLGLHVNGVADTLTRDPAVCATCHDPAQADCVQCHGGIDNGTGAPPDGLRGETATSALAVGAHTTHMEGGTQADAFACTECHVTYPTFASPGHYGKDSIAEMTWGTLAGGGSSWSRGSATCASTYCHGNFTGGVTGNTPVWTGSNQANCGSCHDVGSTPNNLGGEHDRHVRKEGYSCNRCHADVVNGSNIIIGLNLHVDGNNDIKFTPNSGSWDGNNTCSNPGGCHGSENWW